MQMEFCNIFVFNSLCIFNNFTGFFHLLKSLNHFVKFVIVSKIGKSAKNWWHLGVSVQLNLVPSGLNELLTE